MSTLSALGTRRTRGYYTFWKFMYFVIIFAVILGMYYATLEVDYVWRWFRVPQYFWSQTENQVSAEVPGKVKAIAETEQGVEITVSGDDVSETYLIPGDDVWVSKGDIIYPGDPLGTYSESKPGILLQGLWITLKVSILGIIFGIIIGLVTGLCRLSENPALKWLAITYIELIRGSPLLVQIFIWYFVLGTLFNNLFAKFGLPELSSMTYGVASLSVFAGAYVAEIIRAGIQSIHRGQVEAARTLGMTGAQCMRHVVLPQAIRRILPPLAGQFISLIKDSSLLGIIAIRELTKATREIISSSLQPYELWFTCAVLYLILTFSLSMLLQYMEKRMINT